MVQGLCLQISELLLSLAITLTYFLASVYSANVITDEKEQK